MSAARTVDRLGEMRYVRQVIFVAGLALMAMAVCAAAQDPGQISVGPGAAKVITLAGQVSVLHDSQPWALSAGDEVKLGQVILSGPESFAVLQVSDGSTFEVYPNSRVVFRKTPGNLKDLLDVLIGRVKVRIQTWGGQPNFNRVFTPTAVISVRGTVFYVEVEDEEETTLVLVDEGLVEVQHAHHPGTPKLLRAGEWLRVYRNAPLAAAGLDKQSVLKATFRAVSDALYTLVYRTQRIPTIGGGSRPPIGGGSIPLPGDTGGGPLPPAPPLPGDTGGTTTPPPPPPGG
ncbi:MAG TPA: FecR family protein [Bryobacteraceae bacterium]|nr:FecR family protein [Bryobacteraceae bacterium]